MIGKLLSMQMEYTVIPDISPKTMIVVTVGLLFVILFVWKKEA